MPDRGWLGFSRRWWGGSQYVVDPLETVSVGHDEPDACSLDGIGLLVAGVGADFSVASFQRVDGRDWFLEVLTVRAPGGVGAFDLRVSGGLTILSSSLSVRAETDWFVTFFNFAAWTPRARVPTPGGVNDVSRLEFAAPGLLIPGTARLEVANLTGGQLLEASIFGRPA